MSSFLVHVEDDNERRSVLILDAADKEEAAERARYMLEFTSARLVGPPIACRLSPAMAERLA